MSVLPTRLMLRKGTNFLFFKLLNPKSLYHARASTLCIRNACEVPKLLHTQISTSDFLSEWVCCGATGTNIFYKLHE